MSEKRIDVTIEKQGREWVASDGRGSGRGRTPAEALRNLADGMEFEATAIPAGNA